MTSLAMSGLGQLSAIMTLSSDDAADAIWNSFSWLEKQVGNLTDADYQKLRLFVRNAYTDGYVIQKFDNPSQIQKPAPSQIDAEVRRINHGVYDYSELAKAVDNVSRIMDKGFMFTKPAASGISITAHLGDTDAAGGGGFGDILKSAFGAFAAYSPLLSSNAQAKTAAMQQRLQFLQQKNALQAPAYRAPQKDYTGWVLGLGGAALLGIVIIGVLRKRK